MTKKEKKQFAKKLYLLEKKLQTSAVSTEEKRNCELEIMRLAAQLTNIEDMEEIDEMVQDLLMKNI